VKRVTLILLLGTWLVALAQTPPGEESDAVVEAAVPAVPCVPAGESGPLDDEQRAEGGPAGVPGDEQTEQVTAAEPCVEPSPETLPEEEPLLGEGPAATEADTAGAEDHPGGGPGDEFEDEFGGAIEENTLPTEASPEEEFTPGDEISEDYPVPLPSDI